MGRRLLIAVLCVTAAAGAFGQQASSGAPRSVVLTALSAPADDNEASGLALTMTNGLDLLLRLSGVAVSRADFLSPEYDFSKSLMYYKIVGAQAGVFGVVSPASDGGYKIDVDIWTAEGGQTKPTLVSRTIPNALAIFDVADALSLDVASRAVGKQLELGDLQIQFAGGTLPHFAVYADGHLLGRDDKSYRVLTGRREIVVAKPGLVGDETVKAFTVDISPSKAAVVAVDLTPQKAPPPTVIVKTVTITQPAAGPEKAPPQIGRLVFQLVSPSGIAPLQAHLSLSGPSGDIALAGSSQTPFSADLKPGSYEARAWFDDDPVLTTSRADVELGKVTTVSEPVAYSKLYQKTLMGRRRDQYGESLQSINRSRAARLETGLGFVGSSLVAGGVSGYYYYLTTQSFASYQAATTPALAASARATVATDRFVTWAGAAVGGLLLVTGIGFAATLPSSRDMESSLRELDDQIKALGSVSNAPNQTVAGKLKVVSVVPLSDVQSSEGRQIKTVAGDGSTGSIGDAHPATSAQLFYPTSVALDAAGNLYIADYYNSRIRKVDASTQLITTVAGNGIVGSSGDGGPATSAFLHYPGAIAVDRNGNLYIADTGSNTIRRVDAKSGIITTIAGTGKDGLSGDGGPAAAAMLNNPWGLAFDASGALYVADESNNRVRRIDLATGVISTVAGGGEPSSLGDGGPATRAYLNGPIALAFDRNGNLFIAEHFGQRIRKVDRTGTISTVAGSGIAGNTGDGARATFADLRYPSGIAVDGAGNLYISDFSNNKIRVVNPSGIISTLAGNGIAGYSGDAGPAILAELNQPNGITLDASGDLFVADSWNNRVREIGAAP